LTILAREWGNAHALLYVTMATVTFTKQELMTLFKFRPIPGLATGYAPFLEEDRCLTPLQLQCLANRSLALASVFKF
jgi:hypothetical protein